MRTRVFNDSVVTRSFDMLYERDSTRLILETTLYEGSRRFARMDDVVTPRFRALSNQGAIINNPKAKEVVSHTTFASSYKADCTFSGQYTHLTHQSVARVGLTKPIVLITDAEAWQKAYDNFRQETDLAITRAHAAVDVSEMMLLASLGELPETISWLRSLISRLVKVSRAFTRRREVVSVLRTLTYNLQEAVHPKGAKFAARRLDLYNQLLQARKAKQIPRDKIGELAHSWLEYRYAIRPLLADIQNAINLIKSKLTRGQRFTARGKERRIATDVTYDRDNRPEACSFLLYEDLKIERSSAVTARAGVMYAIEENLDTLSTLLGLDQPVASAYELIPFSFVLDWVVGIGDWLQSLTKSSGLSVLSSWVTLTYKESLKVKPLNPRLRSLVCGGHSWSLTEWKPGSHVSEVERVWRFPDPDIPLLPSFDLKLDITKILDLGFILRQVMSGQSISVVKRS